LKEQVAAMCGGFAGCGKTMPARQNVTGLHVCDKPGLSGYLVRLVSLMQPNKPDRPNRPNEQVGLADFFSILLEEECYGERSS
jgi:hypothetical protein